MARLTTQSYVKIGLVVALGVVLVAAVTFGSYSGYRLSFGSNLSQVGSAEVSTDGVENITISWAAGTVDIVVHDGDGILLTEYADQSISRAQQMRWDVVGKTLEIDYGMTVGCNSYRSKHLEVKIPRKLAENMGILDIQGASGDYTVQSIVCKELKVSLASGSASADNMVIEELVVDIASGQAFVEGEVTNKITAEAVSGNIEVRCQNTCPSRVNANIVSGTIIVSIPENDGFTLTMDKVSGNLHSDFSLQQNGSTYTYKNGEASFKADMVSGQFILRKTA